MIRQGRNCWLAGLALAAMLCAGGAGAEDFLDAEGVKAVWRTEALSTRIVKMPFLQLAAGGATPSVKLSWLSNVRGFYFALAPEDAVSSGKLVLQVSAAPSLAALRSQVNVYLNGELQQSVPVTAESVGKQVLAEVTLNPKSFKAENLVSLEFVGQDSQVCGNPANDSAWVTIDGGSFLQLDKQKLRLRSDLAAFPVPFADTISGSPTTLPFVFAKAPSDTQKTAAAVIASAIGAAVTWRGADFPVFVNDTPVAGHFIAFATNADRPDFLKSLPPAKGPELRIADLPGGRYEKILVVSGRDDAELLTAARALVHPTETTRGSFLPVTGFKEPAARKPYDAPRWVNTAGPVKFRDMMLYPEQLASRGISVPPVHLQVRLPPDLFLSGNAEMKVGYRYTRPRTSDSARLRVQLNDYLIDSVNLDGKEGSGHRLLRLTDLRGPLPQQAMRNLALTPVNKLSFSFDYATGPGGQPGMCGAAEPLPNQMEIESDSTLDLGHVYHFAQLPDIGLFTRSGYPFSRMADLSETAVLVPSDATARELSAMLTGIGRIASVTGLPASRVVVTADPKSPELRNRDILAVGSVVAGGLEIDRSQTDGFLAQVKAALKDTRWSEWLRSGPASAVMPNDRAAAIVSFESPFAAGRTVVALLGDGSEGIARLNALLMDPNSMETAKGAMHILSERKNYSLAGTNTYVVGDLPWYHRVWSLFEGHPLVLGLCALLSALLGGVLIFRFMRGWVGRRE